MKAVIIGADGNRDATIKNLSAAGALLSSVEPPKLGSDVVFKRGEIFAAARVARVDGTSYGIEFYRPLDAGMLSITALDENEV